MSEQQTPDALVECRGCGASVLPRPWCSVCGSPLAEATGRRSFAADPSEPALAVRVVSTLFPQLPRADMDAFRFSLGVGAVAVVVLVTLGFLPVALATSAVLVPLLLGVYLYSVDVYEDEPLRVLAVTLLWGAVTGFLFGLLLRELFPARIGAPTDEGATQFLRVVLLPTLATGMIVLGPLALLRFPKFNDVLDGATFGAISGATFVGAQTIAQSIDLLMAGLQPGGDTWSWILRILEHGVAIPLVAGGAVGGVCGALWLRHRAPVPDRHALGLLGHPLAALAVAILLLIGANAALVMLRDLPRLVALFLLAGAALLWLRQLLELGLRQEAVEAATAEPRTCQDCGRETPPGSFCTECGMALRALPKRPARAGEEPGRPTHDEPSRLGGSRSLTVFIVALLITMAVAGAVVLALAPSTRPPCPDPQLPCPGIVSDAVRQPAQGLDQPAPGVMRFGQTWQAEAGWQVDFDSRWWELDDTDTSGALWLYSDYTATTTRGNRVTVGLSLRLEVAPVTSETPDAMLARLNDFVRGILESAVVRDEHTSRLLRPHIGYRTAVARYLVGDFGAQGSVTPYGAHILTASDGRLTAGIIFFVGQPDESFPFFSGSVRTTRYVGDMLDDIVKRFYWTEAGP